MVERYDRGAWSLAELREVPFPDLARAIPEVRAVLEKSRLGVSVREPRRCTRGCTNRPRGRDRTKAFGRP